jgi:O-antigen ligase
MENLPETTRFRSGKILMSSLQHRPRLKPAGPGAGFHPPPTGFQAVLPQDPATQSVFYKVGFALLLFDIFITYSRLNETWFSFKVGPLSLTVATRLATFAFAFLAGGPGRTVSSRHGQLMIVFTLWLCAISPFSAWRRASFDAVTLLWMPSVLLFAGITGLVLSSKDLFKILKIILVGAVFIGVIALKTGATQEYGRLHGGTGSLANANALALYILMGLPCALMLLKLKASRFQKLLILPALCMFLVVLLRSGSRSALINLLAIAIILFFTSSFPSKVRMIAIGGAVIMAALSFTPESSLVRLKLLMPGAEEEELENIDPEHAEQIRVAAEGSSRAREFVFKRAIQHTLNNPIFGVGPEAFMAADAQMAEREELTTIWRGTHNTYAQVAAETGIPGFTMFLALLWMTLRSLLRMRKLTRNVPGLAHLHEMGMCLILMFSSICLSGIFGHFAYGAFYPMIVAFAQVFERATLREVAAFRFAHAGAVPQPGFVPVTRLPRIRTV